MSKALYFSFLLLLCNLSIGQNVIEGVVTDTLGKPINNAQVLLFSVSDSAIVNFTFVNNSGSYSMTTSRRGTFYVEFRALGFATYKKLIELEGNSSKYIKINVVLRESAYSINEVVKYGERPITIKKDTVVYNVKSFVNGSEKVVEDVLKKLPGINVNDDGTVTYRGKEVEKVMVEDNDFFGKGYQMITKNVHANAIEKVEAISNYSENPLLKEIQKSEKVALNLKLIENSYKKFYGNADIGYNTIGDYEVNTSLMNFNKKVSSLFLGNTNTLGYNPINSSYQFSKALAESTDEEKYDLESPDFITKNDGYRPVLKRQRVNDLECYMATVNEALKLSSKTKLTITTVYNQLNDLFLSSRSQVYNYDTISFTNIEEYRFNQIDKSAFVKAKLESRLKRNSFLQYNLFFSGIDRSNTVATDFNQAIIEEQLPGRQYLLKSNLIYSQRVGKRSLAQLKLFGYRGNIDEEYNIFPLPINSLFTSWSINSKGLQSLTNNSQMYMGILGFKHKIRNLMLLEAEVGGSKSENSINSNFFVTDSLQGITIDNNFSGVTNYSNKKFFSKVNFTVGADSLNLSVGLTPVLISSAESNSDYQAKKFFLLPQLALKWKVNKLNTLKFFYDSKSTSLPYYQVINHYLLSNYNLINKGISPKVLRTHILGGNYLLGNMNSRFFLNGSLLYMYEPEFVAQNNMLSPSLIISIDTLANKRSSILGNIELNYFINFLRTNIKLIYRNYTNDYLTFLYGQPNRNKSVSATKGIELRSSFYTMFNFHVGYSTTQGRMINYKSKRSYLDRIFCNIYLKPNERFSFEVLLDMFGNQNNRINLSSDSYLFVNAILSYRIPNSRWSISIKGFNLFDRRLYHLDFVNEYYTSKITYNLIQRYLLLSISFRY
ncbi:MAG: hypothetical protein PWR03_811 [Tenuifilum sp.]|jgi:hypothetical protein|uniref:carboxypeptidase-like regulatory domain-containing protein n=1 Tax=Tenuifilum sp. TaxID=2760880 RepID=UPI0024AC62D9|nr:carboxypeptidase-like regulatory domain-containing protein [Tenuifilum sp.]MDI3526628.1 hypothetical protein [Tenuifilum sp.]